MHSKEIVERNASGLSFGGFIEMSERSGDEIIGILYRCYFEVCV